ncbi:MAG: hypothetical protein Ta2F_13320 [Termitinemataceae bacterium]|nr:MAG: hypothetical protein Ta2F_13320 [Termitinemataceae bacterium]
MKKFLIAYMILLSSICLWAQADNVSLSIRFYDKQLYYPQKGPVYIQLTITNNSPELYRFRLSEDRAFSIDFDTRYLNNKPVELSDVVIRRRSTGSQVFFREVQLESGESFSFTENLRDYSKLDTAGSFIVQAKFYPELYRVQTAASANGAGGNSGVLVATSNRLSLQIRLPSIINETGIPVDLQEETAAVQVRERLAPDDVISWTLHARQRSQWEKFFLYLDLEAMISRDGGRQRQWRAESEEGRRRMLARYRSDLETAKIDGDIVAIPSDFTVERTVYNEDEGTVTVLEKFKYQTFTEKKRYTYYLHRDEGIWTVVDYTVINLGTE